MKKSTKSLHSFLFESIPEDPPTASAFSQARRKFRHTAFTELLYSCLVPHFYGDDLYDTYWTFRLLSIDSSSIRLPNTPELREHYGVQNNTGKKGEHVEGKMSVLYDVLNEMPIHACLEKGRMHDIKLANNSLEYLKDTDLLMADRGYASYEFFSAILGRGANFIIRCPKLAFKNQHRLFETNKDEVVIDLCRPERSNASLPNTLRVRFIRIKLESGETEILATSLTNKREYKRGSFKFLYNKRWTVETYFHNLKSKLSLENFTGKCVESVLQDFWSSITFTAFEALVSLSANEELSKKKTRYPQKVNKSNSFNVIKNRFIELLEEPPEDYVDQITALLTKNPTLVRQQRASPPRMIKGAASTVRSLNYHKLAKKMVF